MCCWFGKVNIDVNSDNSLEKGATSLTRIKEISSGLDLYWGLNINRYSQQQRVYHQQKQTLKIAMIVK